MIGIFDSGLGGLTTVRALSSALPGYDLLYFGDTARTPYGTKSRETVIRYAVENTELLLSRGARAIVMACNTVASCAPDIIREQFDVPIFEVITPAVRLSVERTVAGQIGVIGTSATIRSGIYKRKIEKMLPDAKVFSAACPLLVPLVEEGWIGRPETAMIVRKYLRPLTLRQIDTLILGCTHYPLLKETIRKKIGKRIRIIDSSEATAADVRQHLENHPELDRRLGKEGKMEFLVSDLTDSFEKTATDFLGRRISLTNTAA